MKASRTLPSLLATVGLVALGWGCAVSRPGFIAVSYPRVWQEDATVATTGEQLDAVEAFGKQAKLDELQGRRLRSYLESLVLRLGLSPAAASGTGAGGGAPPVGGAGNSLPAERQTAPLTVSDLQTALSQLKEDPLDGLQRVDDFQQELSGLRLTHLRDTSSMQPGWSLYLLGFDISLMPGDGTSEGHGALVQFQVDVAEGGADDDVRVYTVWPQRYADRFGEALSIREDLALALKEQGTYKPVSFEAIQELAQRHEDTLALVQRYPLVSGFVSGERSFGWEFNPRLRIVTKDRIWPLRDSPRAELWLEPGIRHCYALLLVRDERIDAKNKAVLKLDEEALGALVRDGRCELLAWEDLTKEYDRMVRELLPGSVEREFLAPNLETIKDDYCRLKAMEKKPAEDQEALTKQLGAFHKAVMCLRGHQGKDGVRRLRLTVTPWWFNRRTGRLLPADDRPLGALWPVGRPSPRGASVPAAGHGLCSVAESRGRTTLEVHLPDKLDRTLERIWAVWPSEGQSDKATTVTIRGQNFSNDARVFVGGKEVDKKDVSVIGRDFIVATFPQLDEDFQGAEKPVSVKVVTGGDSLTAEDAFTYYRNPLGWPVVLPDEGQSDNRTRVAIRGRNFRQGAKVLVGSQQAEDVSVISDDLILASFPVAEDFEGEKKTVAVQVLTGGDLFTAANAFTYYKKPAPAAR